MSTLTQALTDRLAKSGLTPANGKAMQVHALTKTQCEALRTKCRAEWPAAEGFVIPYFGIDGKLTKFWRYRYFTTPAPVGFAQATDARPLKYVQAPETLNEIYLPPMRNWVEVGGNPLQSIVITEGELKAAAGCAKGIACIGLGGVYNFGAPKKGLRVLPQFEEITWPGRDVLIVYDSDIATNPQVAIAQNRLAKELTILGARVSFGTLPPAEDGAKQGLDDYLLLASRDQFNTEIADTAVAFGESVALHAMNSEVYMIRSPPLVVEEKSGAEMTVSDFKNSVYANRKFVRVVPQTKGEPKRSVIQTADTWVKWEQRREYSRFIYEPGKPLVHEGGRNRWTGWAATPRKGDVRMWHEMLEIMFDEDYKEKVALFEPWCAYPMQHPGAKMFVAVVMYSRVPGVGKSMLAESLLRIYGKNGNTIEESVMHDRFNDWAKDRQFILAEEATSSEMKPGHVADLLKHIITREEVRINEKNLRPFTVRDCMNYYFPTNHPDAFILADKERRIWVNEILGEPAPPAWYDKYREWMNSDDGRDALFYHLLHVDLKGFNPRAPAPNTKARERMQSSSHSDIGAWARSLLRDPGPLYRLQPIELQRDLFSVADLFAYYTGNSPYARITHRTMLNELQNAGVPMACRGEQIHVPHQDPAWPRLFALRNADKWRNARNADAKAHMQGKVGAQRAAPVAKPKGKARKS